MSVYSTVGGSQLGKVTTLYVGLFCGTNRQYNFEIFFNCGKQVNQDLTYVSVDSENNRPHDMASLLGDLNNNIISNSLCPSPSPSQNTTSIRVILMSLRRVWRVYAVLLIKQKVLDCIFLRSWCN